MPGGDAKLRPLRPRPAVWESATTSVPLCREIGGFQLLCHHEVERFVPQKQPHALLGQHLAVRIQRIASVLRGGDGMPGLLQILDGFPYRRTGNAQLFRQHLAGERRAAVLLQQRQNSFFCCHCPVHFFLQKRCLDVV